MDLGGVVWAESLAVGANPLLGRGLTVDLVELFLRWSGLVGGTRSGRGEDVTANEAEVFGEFSDFSVGNEEGEENSEVLGGWRSALSSDFGKAELTSVGVRLGILLADGNDAALLGVAHVGLNGSPESVLEELIGVLLVYNCSKGLEDVPETQHRPYR